MLPNATPNKYQTYRSMIGERDSEVAIHAQSQEFAESLRKRIWSVALGFSVMVFLFFKIFFYLKDIR